MEGNNAPRINELWLLGNIGPLAYYKYSPEDEAYVERELKISEIQKGMSTAAELLSLRKEMKNGNQPVPVEVGASSKITRGGDNKHPRKRTLYLIS